MKTQGQYNTKQVTVCYEDFRSYAQAIAHLLEATLDACAEKFGFIYKHPIKVEMEKGSSLALWIEVPKPKIHWVIAGEEHLQPPDKGGPWNVYCFIHELGHAVLWVEDAPELSQGWADYFVFTLIPLIWERLGESAWPIPHNYWEQEQNKRANWQRDAKERPESFTAASWYFWKLEERFGADTIGKIICCYNKGEKKLEKLISIIEEITGDSAFHLQQFHGFHPGIILKEIKPILEDTKGAKVSKWMR